MPKQMKKPKRSERETIDAQKPVKRRRKASKELDSAKADQKRNFPMGLGGKEGKAISQFGTDFGMIEKLFPNRTRRLIKSKFKAEERMHLSELRDAMSHHSTDHSHFEKVILLLQALAEEESRQDDAEGDLTTVSQDAADGNEEERDQPVRKQSRMLMDSVVKWTVLRKSMSGMEMILQHIMNTKLSSGMPVFLPLKMRKRVQSTANSTDTIQSYAKAFRSSNSKNFHPLGSMY